MDIRRFLAGLLLLAGLVPGAEAGPAHQVKIGNIFVNAPYGIAFVVDDQTGFLIEPVRDLKAEKTQYGEGDPAMAAPGIAAPDFSFAQSRFVVDGAQVRFTWGRVYDGAVAAKLETDRDVALTLHLPGTTWPQFHAAYWPVEGGLDGTGVKPKGEFVPFRFRAAPAPAVVHANTTFDAEVVLALKPGTPTVFVAGIGRLPALAAASGLLEQAEQTYRAKRATARGDWGDFAGASMDVLNNIRLYGSDNARTVHGIGRGWWMRKDPDLFPYFEWDAFFDAMVAVLEDPKGARDTVRGMLSYQTPDGRVPSFAHWNGEGGTYVTLHRSMPPVGALGVWKMHQRRPDKAFLREVYPKLVRWHAWWMTARDGNRNGLLEWGSEQHLWQGAQYETGWDDNVAYLDAKLADTTLNADAVDLNSLYAMDADYLARIAGALGKKADAHRFAAERAAMIARINARMWNPEAGLYMSRYWSVPETEGVPLTGVFPSGVDLTFYRDRALMQDAVKLHQAGFDVAADGDKPPVPGVAAAGWSMRGETELVFPTSGRYRLRIAAGDGLKVWLDGKEITRWNYDSEERREADIAAEAGSMHPLKIAYAPGKNAGLKVVVVPLAPGKPGSDWITRLTPMNFYPLSAGAASPEQARLSLQRLYDPQKFWLDPLLPTVERDDPEWPKQDYWRGHVWPSANYLVWQGLAQYADDAHKAEFVRRNVNLFMRHWNASRRNCENYSSVDGDCNGEPHYTWSVLLNWIGIEALADIDGRFKPVALSNPSRNEDLVLEHIPFGGKTYRIESHGGKATATPE